MIRIIVESRQDRNNLIKWLEDGLPGHMKAASVKLANRFLGDRDDPERNPNFAPRPGLRNDLKGDRKDMYWWMKNSTPEEFAYFIRDYIPANTEKRFCKLFGKENYELITDPQNRAKILKGRQSPLTWLNIYTKKVNAGEGTPEEIRLLLLDEMGKMADELRLLSKDQLEEMSKGYEIVYQQRGWTIVKVFDYPSSQYWGRGSHWCTTGWFGDGESYFYGYMYHEKNDRDFCVYAKNGRPYYLMYISPNGMKYNVLNKNSIFIGTSGADDHTTSLPDDVPLTIDEATAGDEYSPKGFRRK